MIIISYIIIYRWCWRSNWSGLPPEYVPSPVLHHNLVTTFFHPFFNLTSKTHPSITMPVTVAERLASSTVRSLVILLALGAIPAGTRSPFSNDIRNIAKLSESSKYRKDGRVPLKNSLCPRFVQHPANVLYICRIYYVAHFFLDPVINASSLSPTASLLQEPVMGKSITHVDIASGESYQVILRSIVRHMALYSHYWQLWKKCAASNLPYTVFLLLSPLLPQHSLRPANRRPDSRDTNVRLKVYRKSCLLKVLKFVVTNARPWSTNFVACNILLSPFAVYAMF